MSERTLNFDHLDDADRRLAMGATIATRDRWREISREPGAVNRQECREVANYYERLRVKILTPPSELPSELRKQIERALGSSPGDDDVFEALEAVGLHFGLHWREDQS